jgi:hypothetical protein
MSFLQNALELPIINFKKIRSEATISSEIIPLTRKTHDFKKFVTIGEIVKLTKNGTWNQKDFQADTAGAKKIVWGPQYVGIINKFKSALENKIKEASSSNKNSTRIVYSYVLKHLDQAPFYIKNTPQSTMERKINDKLQETWSVLLHNYIIPHYTQNQQQSETKKQAIESERQKMIVKHQQDVDMETD